MAEKGSVLIRIYPETKAKLDAYCKDIRYSLTQTASRLIDKGIADEEKEKDNGTENN